MSTGKERIWVRNQSGGELDDGKIVDGLSESVMSTKNVDTTQTVQLMEQMPPMLLFVLKCSL